MNFKWKPIGMTAIFGLLAGVVLSSMTGDWWWIGIGFAIGMAIAAVRNGGSAGS